MLERDIVKKIKIYLNSLPYTHVWKMHGGRFSIPGMSDLIGLSKIVTKGRFLAVEVKVPGNEPTLAQKVFIKIVNKLGGIAFVATSVDDVKECLKELEFERSNL